MVLCCACARLPLQYVFDYRDGDVFGCVADIGWITGHSYVVYGPLANGGTSVLFESTPIYPDPGTEADGQLSSCFGLLQLKRQNKTKMAAQTGRDQRFHADPDKSPE